MENGQTIKLEFFKNIFIQNCFTIFLFISFSLISQLGFDKKRGQHAFVKYDKSEKKKRLSNFQFKKNI